MHLRVVVALGMIGLAGCPSDSGPPGGPGIDASPPASSTGLGASLDGDDVVFRLAAPRATRVEVWIYAAPVGDAALHAVADGGPVWTARVALADLAAAGVSTIYYGYRVWGPSWVWDPAWTPGSSAGYVTRVDGDGNRMNPNKLLIDPYAREISHDPVGLASPSGDVYRTDDANRATDSGPVAAKSIALFDVAGDFGIHPDRELADDVIYEVHLRGLTAADVSDACRGTYAAAASRAGELAALGVTAVEFLPLQETTNDRNDLDPASADGDNYWGYSTLAFFAPDRRYACDRSPGGPTRELQAMVRAYHERGIKVFVDVVYNHTAEGGGASLLSWRGIDNATYYELDDDGTGFADQTGIGASTNATTAVFRDLVIDSLRYWHDVIGVDGFRFDLAPILANACERGCFAFDADAPGNVLARAVTDVPGADLIAEPWGVVAGTYQIGNFPAGWSEWNDKYRDLIRQDQNQLGVAAVTPGWLANRIAGSPELFGARGPSASIDYIVSHDGFTLRDLYACNAKDNDQEWPYGPSNGGSDDNKSWDQTGNPSRQRQAARTGLALLALSAGVPMIVGGDEVLRSQRCNNNPYNIDSVATWHDPEDAIANAAFRTFAQRLFGFRADHAELRPRTWQTAIAWYRADGAIADAAYVDDPANHFLAWHVGAIYVAYNGGTTTVAAYLPTGAWNRVADTAAWLEPENFAAPGDEQPLQGTRYDLHPRSLAIFVER